VERRVGKLHDDEALSRRASCGWIKNEAGPCCPGDLLRFYSGYFISVYTLNPQNISQVIFVMVQHRIAILKSTAHWQLACAQCCVTTVSPSHITVGLQDSSIIPKGNPTPSKQPLPSSWPTPEAWIHICLHVLTHSGHLVRMESQSHSFGFLCLASLPEHRLSKVILQQLDQVSMALHGCAGSSVHQLVDTGVFPSFGYFE
jgi:hypothetical protein